MPLLWLSLVFLSGILLAANISIPLLAWILLALAALMLLLPPVYRRWARIIPPPLSNFTQQLKITSLILYPLLLLFMSLGAIRYLVSLPAVNPSFIAYHNDQPAEYILDSVLVEPSDNRETYTNLRLRIEQLTPVGDDKFTQVHGLILARISPVTTFSYGDRIRLQGHLETPPENEDFSYRDYLASQRIYSYIAYTITNFINKRQATNTISAVN